ncbi:MAG: acyl-ACP--UDP-N-acetylglucosamine O-acyltransferase [Candidatus Euphemobacter frigidus]|nr:acyl-ACP--UDP-N-acetylglucosamine O-acyltransferase [Candidatus Euphemobacter frigidus]MDP8275501.1 acyl-ACP--UDP-N-acetylglucosamine O-acyltransferase [Candidatus Euphemobacter frigidus]
MSVHKTAIVDPAAEIDPGVEIGPYAIIEGKVKIAAGTRVMAHAYITSNTTIGPDNVIHPFAVLGHAPQDLSYRGEESFLQIGRGNTFREGCSVHRGSKEGFATVIGDNNFLMGYCHVAHDCILGNEVIIANGALLAGHVHIADKAFISGNATIHQFVEIGTLAMIGGLARVTKGVPPYMTVVGDSRVVSMNVVGLKRAGFTPEERVKIKRAYKLLYHSGLNVSQAVKAIEKEDLGPGAEAILNFISRARRGICKHA